MEGRSLSVQVDPKSLPVFSAHIDLNPVRACFVDDSKDYRYSGYGASIGGKMRLLELLCCGGRYLVSFF